jgi:hypothetical protein
MTQPSAFQLDEKAILQSNRVILGDWVKDDLADLSDGLKALDGLTDCNPKQHGRVIAIRATDAERLFSGFKAALYLGKYKSMQDTNRFLNHMVKSHHSYEPIRGENILFLFVGVGKPVYDHLVTYTVGRPTRIAGGQRANLPWGIEVPTEIKDREGYIERNMKRVTDVITLVGKGDEKPEVREQLQAARSELPVGYIMPPFLMEFTEEALAKTVFRQRLWEQGAQGATVDVVNDMYKAVLQIDAHKWETLLDFHGPHTVAWEKAMRTLRDKQYTLEDILTLGKVEYNTATDGDESRTIEVDASFNLYDLLISTVGKLPPTMWDKIK